MNPCHKTAMLYARAQELFHQGEREEALNVKRQADELQQRTTEKPEKQEQTDLQTR